MKRFEVIEGFNGYYLYDRVTGRPGVCMGDGVDEPFGEIGSEEFRQAWEDEANLSAAEYFEAYFPDLYGLEVWDDAEFLDRYTVLLGEAAPLEKSMWACENLHDCLTLSDDPEQPQGFSQFGWCDPTISEGQRHICFLDLPENVQRHVAERLEEK